MLLNYEMELSAKHDNWIVFVHGAGGNIKTWKHQREAFQSKGNLLFIDLRDHGESEVKDYIKGPYTFDLIAKDVLYLLERLEIDKATFIALSMGSLIVHKISELKPELIENAIIAGGIFDVDKKIQYFSKLAMTMSYLIPFRLNYWIFSLMIMPKRNHQEARKIFIRQAQKLSPEAYRRWIGLYAEFKKMVERFKKQKLSFPLLAVMGGQDYIFLKSAERYVNLHRRAKLFVIPQCGHICNIEQAEEFNRLALNWLKIK